MRLRRVIYALLLVTSMVFMSIFGGTVSYAFFFAMILVPVLSLGYILTVFSQFKIYQEVESRDVVADAPMGYYFILKNDSFISFSSIQIRMFSGFSEIEELPSEEEFCLTPGEQYRYETRLFCKYRGEYEVGIKEVILTDFFRLFRFKYRIPGTIKAIVSPNLINLPRIEKLNETITLSSNDSFNSKEELDIEVRAYAPGDNMHNINWKMSAKTGELLSRKYTGEKKQGIGIIMDSRRYYSEMEEYLPLENQLLKAMLAVNLYLIKQDIPVHVIDDNFADIYRIGDIRQFNQFYSQVVQYRFRADFNPESYIDEHMGQLGSLGVVILFTHELTEHMIMAIKQITNNGTYVIVYIVGNDLLSGGVNNLLSQNAFRGNVIHIPVHSDLEEVLG